MNNEEILNQAYEIILANIKDRMSVEFAIILHEVFRDVINAGKLKETLKNADFKEIPINK